MGGNKKKDEVDEKDTQSNEEGTHMDAGAADTRDHLIKHLDVLEKRVQNEGISGCAVVNEMRDFIRGMNERAEKTPGGLGV